MDDAGATAEMFLHFIKMLTDREISTMEEINMLGEGSVESKAKLPSYHAIMLAENNTGRVNL